MPPRFMQRMTRQSETLKAVFGEPTCDPPPYPASHASGSESSATSKETARRDKSYLSPPPQYSNLGITRIPDEDTALPKGSLILVTGASGYLGAHVVDQLLQQGYHVRGTVRNAEKDAWTSKFFKNKYEDGQFTTVIVPDMARPGAFNSAVQGCAGVVHIASVTIMSPDPYEVIAPSIAGAVNALQAAAREGVKRFVYCSCVAAAVASDRSSPDEVSSESWNMADFTEAWAPPPYKDDRALAVYASSKMQAESAVWRWYRRVKPAFVLNTVLPDTLWGRVAVPQHQNYPSSAGILKKMHDGKVVTHPPRHFVDVQDTALIHVAALLFPDIVDQRIIATCTLWNVNSISRILGALYPDRAVQGESNDLSIDVTRFSASQQAEKLLQRMGKKGWTDLKTSIPRTLESWL